MDCLNQVRAVSLNEAEAKKLLRSYGVPVVEEKVAHSAQEAAELAASLGFPVVVKGLGRKLLHKTEKGLVKLHVRDLKGVQQACREIGQAAGKDLEGLLVQRMVEGRREFVAGLFRDRQFGPVVMFGLGGIFTEALNDVAFRIAPVDESQAEEMLGEILSSRLLSAFRGEDAANRGQLIKVLTGLSRLGLEHREVQEVDINPLLISPDGRVTAVDALVIAAEKEELPDSEGDKEQTPEEAKEIRLALEVMTNPQSIAVVGATRQPPGGYPGMFACVKRFGFPGKLYPINPQAKEIEGLKAYPSLASLPGPVDLVIIAVPAQRTPEALRDCAATGNRNIHIFSSGFRETGEEEGIRLQDECEEIARQEGLHVIGPNSMGFYVPKSRILTWTAGSKESGHVAFISQSGGNTRDFTTYAGAQFGIRFSKAISYGNALTLDCTDFLEYLAYDDETRVIGLYLEGVKNGRKLIELIRKISRQKPIVLMKGGLSESGARAASSHTGAMAGAGKIWRAAIKQSGTLMVDSLEEMADVILALDLSEPAGRRVAVIGTGGGISVTVADACARVGLDLPALPRAVVQELQKFIPTAGNIIGNPMDAKRVFFYPTLLGNTLALLAAGHADMFLLFLQMDWLCDEGADIERLAAYLAQSARQYAQGKPLAVAWRQYVPDPEAARRRVSLEKTLLEAGIPVYEGLHRAGFALAKLCEYHEFQRKQGHLRTARP